jgi:hypothetical protein
MDTITITLTRETMDRLRADAEQTGLPVEELARDVVDRYYRPPDDDPLAGLIGSYSDGRIQGADYEDWLREHWKPDW